MKEAFNESLFKFLKSKLEVEFKEAEKHYLVDECEDVLEALELCNKLLTYDYFKKSESVLDNFADDGSDYKKKVISWGIQYTKDLKQKKKDMNKLFALIADNCEEWC